MKAQAIFRLASGFSAALILSVAAHGAITPRLTNGSVTVNAAFSIAGRVGYWSDPTRAVPGTVLTLEGVGTVTNTSVAG